jgi:hypothetical protein
MIGQAWTQLGRLRRLFTPRGPFPQFRRTGASGGEPVEPRSRESAA